MKNVLLIANNYPIPNVNIYGGTKVCHYFAKEMVKMGFNVKVIFCYTIYMPFLHFLGSGFKESIGKIFPTSINSIRYKSPVEYNIDGVDVLLIPCYKPIPKIKFKKKSINKAVDEIIEYLHDNNFQPDIVTSHFLHPSLEIVSKLKNVLKVPVGVTLHGKIETKNDINAINEARKTIDFWGFRSFPIRQSFEKNCFIPSKSLMCFSGIPSDIINSSSWEKHNKESVAEFCFIGNLINRKYPLEVVHALSKSDLPYKLKIIGSGGLENKINRYINNHNLKRKVYLLGRIPRQEIFKELENTECFIMISKDETFGLVYLEAMAKGCIVIASKNEGMEGIIVNGVNGYLCSSGDENELSLLIQTINKLTIEGKINISQNALKTVSMLTDEQQAKYYIENLIQITNED